MVENTEKEGKQGFQEGALRPVKDVHSFEEYLSNIADVGFQSTQIGRAAAVLKQMLMLEDNGENARGSKGYEWEQKREITTYLAFTANMVASGMRGLLAKLVQKKLFDVIITTGGAIEHDVMKTFTNYYLIDFASNDTQLHKREMNRIGNIGVKTESYIRLEEICKEVLAKEYERARGTTPSDLSAALGKYIDEHASEEAKEGSFVYWAYKHGIPIFSPGITDSAMGLQLYFFKQQYADFTLDVTGDMKKLANITLNAEKTGALILGGGISKHHTIGVNIARGGLDYAIYVSTASEFDGSLSGARSSEAISWGKIKEKARHVDVYGEVSVVLPLLLKAAGIL